MNERIRELATQAGYKDFDYAIIAHKFAELIIAECATICVEVSDTTRIDDTPHEGDVCSYKIKQHFGVE